MDRTLGQARDIGREARTERFRFDIGRQLRLQFGLVGERKLLGVGLDEKIERVDDRKFGGEIDLDFEFRHFFRKHKPRLPIAVRVLLPVHEMLGWRHFQRISGDFGAAMGGRAQPDGLRLHHDRPIIFIVGHVMNGGGDGHVVSPNSASRRSDRLAGSRCDLICRITISNFYANAQCWPPHLFQ